jgi:hypothetical protein
MSETDDDNLTAFRAAVMRAIRKGDANVYSIAEELGTALCAVTSAVNWLVYAGYLETTPYGEALKAKGASRRQPAPLVAPLRETDTLSGPQVPD